MPVAGGGSVPGEDSARERAPGEHGDAHVEALRDHLALFLAVEEVVVVLHRDEPRPAVTVGGRLGLRELPGVHAARADEAGLAGADDVVECLHRLLDRRGGVPAVDLVEVDVVEPEPCERGVDRREHVLAAEPAAVLAGHRASVHLRCEHVLLTAEKPREDPAGDDLALAGVVDVRGVEERHAALDRAADDRLGGLLGERPLALGRGAEAHHPQAQPRHPQPRPAEVHVLQRRLRAISGAY